MNSWHDWAGNTDVIVVFQRDGIFQCIPVPGAADLSRSSVTVQTIRVRSGTPVFMRSAFMRSASARLCVSLSIAVTTTAFQAGVSLPESQTAMLIIIGCCGRVQSAEVRLPA